MNDELKDLLTEIVRELTMQAGPATRVRLLEKLEKALATPSTP
jgi:hypothetical protein